MATKDDTPCVGSTSEDIVEDKEEFKNKSWRTDVTLKVEDRLFYVNKYVLGAASPVLEAMFGGENENKDISEIPLADKKSSDVLEFLRCIYPNVLKPVTEYNVLSVLPLAVEYQVTSLMKKCETYLLKRLDEEISTEQLCTIMLSAHTYKVQSVFDKCEQIAITRQRVDFEKACNEVSMPVEVEMKIMTEMFLSIETKYQSILKENFTAKAFCKMLCHVDDKQHLVDRFLQGGVTVKVFHFAISSPYDKSFDIDIDKNIFTVRFKQIYNYKQGYSEICVFIKCCNLVKGWLICHHVLILKNWMTRKTGLVKNGQSSFNDSDPSDKKLKIFEALTSLVQDETKGYIYKGVCNFEFYLFIYHS